MQALWTGILRYWINKGTMGRVKQQKPRYLRHMRRVNIMRIYCPVHVNTLLKIVGMAYQKPLYCKECNKSYTYEETKKGDHD